MLTAKLLYPQVSVMYDFRNFTKNFHKAIRFQQSNKLKNDFANHNSFGK